MPAMLAHAHPAVTALHTKKPSVSSDGLPSPTLTNPDMILPSQKDESEPSTPTRFTSVAPPSPSSMRPPEAFVTTSPTHSISPDNESQLGGQKFGTPRMLRYQHGGPLSDIDEERTPTSDRFSRISILPSSPTILGPLASLQPHDEERASSSCSSSTASAGSGLTEWLKADDDIATNGGSDIYTDLDRNSDAGGEAEEKGKRNSLDARLEDDFPSAALTHKAESILANAKKRLTNMESHLNRARSSLLVSPPFSPINGEFSPTGLYRSVSQGDDRRWEPISRTPRTLILASKHQSPGHSRVLSDTSINPHNRIHDRPGFRSASAMETTFGSSIDALLHNDSPGSMNGSHKAQSPTSGSSHTFNTPLKALKEDDMERDVTPQSSAESTQTTGLGISNTRSMESFRSRQSTGERSPGPSRSNSQLSTHDIRNQMNSLRNRISNLKTRAQEDSLRRRSTQNVRPSSSYSVAEQWYTSAPEYQESGSPLNTNAGLGWSPTQEQMAQESSPQPAARESSSSPQSIVKDASPERDVQTALALHELPPQNQNKSNEPPSAHHHHRSDSQDLGEESVTATVEEQVYLNEALEESLHAGDESFENPEFIETILQPERHEDRADAFDYEHFFLHSAIGNYSSLGMHQRNGSRASTASADSVVTARAANSVHEEESDTPRGSTAPPAPFASHGRNNSVDSISTMATFQTATEGDGSDDEDQDKDESDALGWSGHRPMPGSMDSSQYLPMRKSTEKSRSRSRTRTITPSPATIATAPLPNGSLPTPPITSPRSPDSPLSSYDHVLSVLRSVGRSDSILPLGPDDTELAVDLLKSLQAVCGKMAEDSDMASTGRRYENRTFRRRLDAAKRVLDGALEVDGL